MARIHTTYSHILYSYTILLTCKISIREMWTCVRKSEIEKTCYKNNETPQAKNYFTVG